MCCKRSNLPSSAAKSHRRPDREGNSGRANCEEIGVSMNAINVITIVISLCAIALTAYGLYATRRHNRLSVTPHLADYNNKSITNEGLIISYDISNNGIGPAKIKSFVLFREEKPFPRGNDDYVDSFVRAHLGNRLKYEVRHSFNFGNYDSLKAGDTRNVLNIFFPGAKSEDRGKILEMFGGIGLRIEYESFYGEKFVLERKSDSKLMDASSR